jgi:CPA2 family monovalent cation:H+ antiporter-2
VEGDTSLLLDVCVALGVAFAGGWLATRLHLPSLIGYIAAGLVISPFTPGFVGDVDRLRLLADIGVVLLLFGVGVEFSLQDLRAAGASVVALAVLQTALVFCAVWALCASAGMDRDVALYAGAAAAVSSSVVLAKLIDVPGGLASVSYGRMALAWSVVQDLLAIVLVLLLDAVTGDDVSTAGVARDAALTSAKAIAFLAVVLIIGVRALPDVLHRLDETRSGELFVLGIATLVIGTALASEYIGLSLALGAFLAGIVVSESALSHRVLDALQPARDVFAVLFFVAAGMLVDPAVVSREWQLIAILCVGILALKPLVVCALALSAGKRARLAVLIAAVLLPAAEFSFLLGDAGLDSGAIDEDAFGAIMVAAVASIAVSPFAYQLARRGAPASVLHRPLVTGTTAPDTPSLRG